MEVKLNVKAVDFAFSDYLTQGFEILKKDYGKFLGAFLLTVIMAIIPFCGLLALGNFYKFFHKTFKGERAEASEIFNFDDFLPYFYLQLIIIGGVLFFEIPIIIFAVSTHHLQGDSGFLAILFPIYILLFIVFILYFILQGFYMPALISVGRVKGLKTAWKMSKEMTKGNLLFIFLFFFVLAFLSQVGIVLCFVGVLLTLPYNYICQFLAFDDAIKQIKYDDLQEIGNQ